jgi:hypothetical protein
MALGFVSAHPRLFVGLAVVAAAGLAGGAAVALVNAGDDSAVTASAAAPTPAATSSVTPSPTPAPELTPTAAPTPSATPAATPSATASASASASARASATRYAFPVPTRQYDGLRFTATNQVQGATTVTVLTITATDGDGEISFGGLTWGDGSSAPAEAGPGRCPVTPSPTAAPGPYAPHATKRTLTLRHTYPSKQPVSITVTMRSANTTCRPNGPKAEAQTLTLPVTFAADPTPTPSAV